MPLEETSLDRYLESRAGYILGNAHARWGLMIMGLVGSLMIVIGFVFGLLGTVGGQPDVLPAMAAPLMAGFINLVFSLALRRRVRPAFEVNTELTPQARTFMAELMKDVFDWPYAWGSSDPREWGAKARYMRRRERRVWRRMIGSGSWGKRSHSAKEFLQPSAFEALDTAAFHYNRVAAVLATGGPSVTKFGPTVRAAADQAMADIFNISSVLDRYPEGTSSAQAEAEKHVASLKELGDRLETMQASDAAGLPATSGSSPMDSVLEELRLDQLARSELANPPEQEQHQQQR
jgi:hypothetical protein